MEKLTKENMVCENTKSIKSTLQKKEYIEENFFLI